MEVLVGVGEAYYNLEWSTKESHKEEVLSMMGLGRMESHMMEKGNHNRQLGLDMMVSRSFLKE